MAFHIGSLKTLQHLRWYEHFMSVLIKYGFEELASEISKGSKGSLAARLMPKAVIRVGKKHTHAQRVRMALEELGPTFIKLGQLLSVRPDLIPQEYVNELQYLQDQVPPDNFEIIRNEIEIELGADLSKLFDRFEEEPIAAGSIAQVHKALTPEGDTVVVKVRRPNIAKTIKTEGEIITHFAKVTEGFLKRHGVPDPVRIANEFSKAMSKEVDLGNEREVQERFYRYFLHDETVKVPKVYPKYCTKSVLTMEYIDGLKLVDKNTAVNAGLDPLKIADNGIRYLLKQIFEFHLFHTDPHRGNIFLLPNNVVCLIDFGQVSYIDSATRKLLLGWTKALVRRDLAGMMRTFRHEHVMTRETDFQELGTELEYMFDSYAGLPSEEVPFRDIMTQNMDIIRRHRAVFPSGFSLVLKSLLTIYDFSDRLGCIYHIIPTLRESVWRQEMQKLDMQHLRLIEYALFDAGEMLVNLPRHTNAILTKLEQGEFGIKVRVLWLDELIKALYASVKYVGGGAIIAALLISSTLLMEHTGSLFGVVDIRSLGITVFIIAGILGIVMVISLIRRWKL